MASIASFLPFFLLFVAADPDKNGTIWRDFDGNLQSISLDGEDMIVASEGSLTRMDQSLGNVGNSSVAAGDITIIQNSRQPFLIVTCGHQTCFLHRHNNPSDYIEFGNFGGLEKGDGKVVGLQIPSNDNELMKLIVGSRSRVSVLKFRLFPRPHIATTRSDWPESEIVYGFLDKNQQNAYFVLCDKLGLSYLTQASWKGDEPATKTIHLNGMDNVSAATFVESKNLLLMATWSETTGSQLYGMSPNAHTAHNTHYGLIEQAPVTSIHGLVRGDDVLVIAGTSTGNIMKILLRNDILTILYNERLDVLTTRIVSSQTHIYVGSGRRLYRFPTSTCVIYDNCTNCRPTEDPLKCPSLRTSNFKKPFKTIILSLASVLIVSIIVLVIFLIRRRRLGKMEKCSKYNIPTIEQTVRSISIQSLTESKVVERFSQMDKLIPTESLIVGDVISSGNFGVVHEGHLGHVKVAVKALHIATPKSIEDFMKEALIMVEFDHENILPILGINIDNGLDSPLLILPFMEKGDLLTVLRNPVEEPSIRDLISFARQIAQGMDYLSSRRFLHRDLAARNCMIDHNQTIKIADFGLCKDIYESGIYIQQSDTRLPFRWTAPESLTTATFTTKSDVWSFGIVLWEIMTRGNEPTLDLMTSRANLLDALMAGERLYRPQFCPHPIYEIMQDCWQINPDDRPTFADITLTIDRVIRKLSSSILKKPYVNRSNYC